MSGASIAAEIAAAYEEVGQEAGDGLGAVTVTIARPGPPIGPAYTPRPGAAVDHTFTAKPVSIEQAQREGVTLAAGERVYSLVNHGVTIAPTVADELSIGGKKWSVVEVIAKDAAGHVLTWLVKVRGPVG